MDRIKTTKEFAEKDAEDAQKSLNVEVYP